LSLSEKRKLIGTYPSLSIQKQCKILDISASSFYYKPTKESALNLELMSMMDRHYHYHPYKGGPSMYVWLTKDKGYEVSRNRVYRLYYEVMGLRAIAPGPHTTIRSKNHAVYPYLLRNLTISYSNQVWATDITYIPLPQGFMYLTAVIDLFSRFVLAWSLSNTMEAQWCKQLIEEAISQHGKPQILNTDQGAQYTSTLFADYIVSQQIKLSMDGVGRATDNAFIERLWRTVKYENIRFNEYTDGKNLAIGLDSFFIDYNTIRRHSSLDYRMPIEVFYG
jgi:putative transposase